MNIEIANRLITLRKKCGYSQEELASKLGLSRQSVSKWERAEASPDTDNLIELARLYHISLDDLLNPEVSIDEVIDRAVKNDGSIAPEIVEDDDDDDDDDDDEEGDYVHIGPGGINVRDADGSRVDISIAGVHVSDKYGHRIKVPADKKKSVAESITVGALFFGSILFYLLFGFLYEDHSFAWSIGWIAFLLVPIVGSVFECFRKRKISSFAYPILMAAIYCFFGIGFGLWHPLWVVFISIPLFYAVVSPIDRIINKDTVIIE